MMMLITFLSNFQSYFVLLTHTCEEFPHQVILSATDDTLIFSSRYELHFF